MGPGESLQSAENRVFRFGDVILKFFHPRRWSPAALEEEHRFLLDLQEADVPAVRPRGEIDTWSGVHFAVYDAVPGPYREDPKTLTEADVRQYVHLLARLHGVGACRVATERGSFDVDGLGAGLVAAIVREGLIPNDLVGPYTRCVDALVAHTRPLLDGVPHQRIHDDPGSWNMLWRPSGPVMMDLDDFTMGPVAIDVRMLREPWRLDALPEAMGGPERRASQQRLVVDLYREHHAFPAEWERLFRPTGIFRAIRFDAWFSARWRQPGFAAHYPDEDPTAPSWWRKVVETFEGALEELGA